MKRDIITQYNLPKSVRFCNKCTISNQRPRISFDEHGICSACNYSRHKKTVIDWSARSVELDKLCDKHRSDSGEYDVVVPCSGGKDGSYVAHQLKHQYGMNPLTVTWAPLLPTETGRKNLDSFISCGFSHILGTPDPLATRKLTALAFKHLGDPFQPFIYGQSNFPTQIALKHDIKLIMYGENGEVEYGGLMESANSPTWKHQDNEKIYFSGLAPELWESHGVSKSELFPFTGPPLEKVLEAGIERHFFGYYKFWDPQENYYYALEHTGFRANSERSEGTYSKYASLDDKIDGFHYYLAYIKFGIGRATADSAHEIRDGKIERDEGIALIKRYDGEFPVNYYEEFLEYCEISDRDARGIVDSWRSDHLWKKDGKEWRLRKPIWE